MHSVVRNKPLSIMIVIIFCTMLASLVSCDVAPMRVKGTYLGVEDIPRQATKHTVLSNHGIKLTPRSIIFGVVSMCQGSSRSFSVKDKTMDAPIDIISVHSDSIHFRPSFNSSARNSDGSVEVGVVFLPRVYGSLTGLIVVETNRGSFTAMVQGQCIPNEIGLETLAAIPAHPHEEVVKQIRIRNSKHEALKVVEVFSSEEFLILKLPDNGDEDMWTFQPGEQKDLVSLVFRQSHVGSYKGYIHVVTTSSSYVVTVEILVKPQNSVLFDASTVNFGYLECGSTGNVHLPLHDLALASVFELRNVDITGSTAEAEQSIILHEVVSPTPGVLFTYVPRSPGHFSGEVSFNTNSTDKLPTRIPFRGYGSDTNIWYDKGQTMICLSAKWQQQSHPDTNMFAVRNELFDTVLFLGARVNDSRFLIHQEERPVSMRPGEDVVLFSLDFSSTGHFWGSKSAELVIFTNVTDFIVPVEAFYGQLECNRKEFDFGRGGVEGRELSATFHNSNPVDVIVTSCEVVGSMFLRADCSMKSPFSMKPGGDFSVNVRLFPDGTQDSVSQLGIISASLQIETSFEVISVPIAYVLSVGDILFDPPVVHFEPSFESTEPIMIRAGSTYNFPVKIEDVVSSDPRIVVHVTKDIVPEIHDVDADANILSVSFDPSSLASVTLGSSSPCLKTLFRAQTLDDCEVRALESLAARSHRSSLKVEGSIQVYTNASTPPYSLRVDAALRVPTLVASPVEFGVHPTWSIKRTNFTVCNPSTIHSLELRLLSLKQVDPVHLARVHQKLEILKNAFQLGSPDSFSVTDKVFIIPAGMCSNRIGPVEFFPRGHVGERKKSIIFVKNNLTVLEAVEVMGTAGSGLLSFETELKFTLDGLRPGGKQPEQERIQDSGTAATYEGGSDVSPPAISSSFRSSSVSEVVKSFVVRNSGNLAVDIDYVRISPSSAFTISPESFRLDAGAHVLLEVEFFPDGTLPHVDGILEFFSGNDIIATYPFDADVSREMLPLFSEVRFGGARWIVLIVVFVLVSLVLRWRDLITSPRQTSCWMFRDNEFEKMRLKVGSDGAHDGGTISEIDDSVLLSREDGNVLLKEIREELEIRRSAARTFSRVSMQEPEGFERPRAPSPIRVVTMTPQPRPSEGEDEGMEQHVHERDDKDKSQTKGVHSKEIVSGQEIRDMTVSPPRETGSERTGGSLMMLAEDPKKTKSRSKESGGRRRRKKRRNEALKEPKEVSEHTPSPVAEKGTDAYASSPTPYSSKEQRSVVDGSMVEGEKIVEDVSSSSCPPSPSLSANSSNSFPNTPPSPKESFRSVGGRILPAFGREGVKSGSVERFPHVSPTPRSSGTRITPEMSGSSASSPTHEDSLLSTPIVRPGPTARRVAPIPVVPVTAPDVPVTGASGGGSGGMRTGQTWRAVTSDVRPMEPVVPLSTRTSPESYRGLRPAPASTTAAGRWRIANAMEREGISHVGGGIYPLHGEGVAPREGAHVDAGVWHDYHRAYSGSPDASTARGPFPGLSSPMEYLSSAPPSKHMKPQQPQPLSVSRGYPRAHDHDHDRGGYDEMFRFTGRMGGDVEQVASYRFAEESDAAVYYRGGSHAGLDSRFLHHPPSRNVVPPQTGISTRSSASFVSSPMASFEVDSRPIAPRYPATSASFTHPFSRPMPQHDVSSPLPMTHLGVAVGPGSERFRDLASERRGRIGGFGGSSQVSSPPSGVTGSSGFSLGPFASSPRRGFGLDESTGPSLIADFRVTQTRDDDSHSFRSRDSRSSGEGLSHSVPSSPSELAITDVFLQHYFSHDAAVRVSPSRHGEDSSTDSKERKKR
eukprot:TRINITY_DN2879_c0_g1_i1.p1 TRINITY_DN2879_c0_g1~~TRINITY_DN2879_c0_g1_i1.p1  ORF type:complete len:1812 (+),score=420.38 TRINITY_DN2879_c0_g1_i1:568-6003(+)